jgi:hypothetical protein
LFYPRKSLSALSQWSRESADRHRFVHSDRLHAGWQK